MLSELWTLRETGQVTCNRLRGLAALGVGCVSDYSSSWARKMENRELRAALDRLEGRCKFNPQKAFRHDG